MPTIYTRITKAFSHLKDEAVKEKIEILQDIDKRKKSSVKRPFIVVSSKAPQIESLVKRNTYISLISNGESLSEKSGILSEIYLSKNFNVIGVQGYLLDNQIDANINMRGCEVLNLGRIRDDITSCEPLLRDSEYIILDLNSIKHSDFTISSNPNGFYSDEICQIAYYIGLSLNLKGLFIYGLDEKAYDVDYALVAQIIWHVANGISANHKEDPNDAYKRVKNSENFEHKIVDFNGEGQTIVFIRSLLSQRLWIEIPVVKKNKVVLIPCSIEDYKQATSGDIPVRWLFYYNRYNSL